jgi:hypothetical protein
MIDVYELTLPEDATEDAKKVYEVCKYAVSIDGRMWYIPTIVMNSWMRFKNLAEEAAVMIEKHGESLERLQKVCDIQFEDGVWNYDSYNHGLVNGLILAIATLTDTEPHYLEAPEVYLKDE